MRTEFEFVLPRGYIDDTGTVHRRGMMRLATARDELQPLRDPTVSGPDDPRLTLLVLVRVIERLGSIDTVTMHEVEQLFAADLAYLQDFYGVINFGSDEDIDALLAAQNEAERPPPVTSPQMTDRPETGSQAGSVSKGPEERPRGRRAAIQEVPSTSR
jgi:hypothetical protein